MPNQPLVSIIIPTYNRAHLIGETLNSVLAQTYANWECIVVDDGSTDGTDKLMKKYCDNDLRFQYNQRPKNRPKGANACRNYGFELSKGEYVNWFDSDDLMHLKKIEIQMNVLSNEKLNFSVCEIIYFEEHPKNILKIKNKNLKSENSLFDFIRKDVVFFTPAPIFKKSFLLKFYLKFDEKLQSSQEWELFCRVLYYSPNYHAISTPLVYVRKHEDSIRSNSNIQLINRNYFISRNKILSFLRKEKKNLPPYMEVFFMNFFMKYYVEELFQREFRQVIKYYFKNIYYNFSFFENIKILFYSFIVLTTGKGYKYRNRFLKK